MIDKSWNQNLHKMCNAIRVWNVNLKYMSEKFLPNRKSKKLGYTKGKTTCSNFKSKIKAIKDQNLKTNSNTIQMLTKIRLLMNWNTNYLNEFLYRSITQNHSLT